MCLVCGMKLSNQAMIPSKLQRHPTRNHPSLASKGAEYFFCLKSQINRQEQMMMKCAKVSERVLEARYLVAQIVAKAMKPHTIVETVILPACTATVNKILDPQGFCCQLECTIGRRINDMSEDIEDVLLEKI